MPSPTPPDAVIGTPIDLDRRRQLYYDFQALRELKWKHGINLLRAMDDDALNDPDALVAVLWAGCLRDDPSVTAEAIARAITMKDLPRIMDAITNAWGVSMHAELAPAAPLVAVPVPTGAISGPTPSGPDTAVLDSAHGSCIA